VTGPRHASFVRLLAACACLLAVGATAVGCGSSTVDRSALQRDAGDASSIAAEGASVAKLVRQDRVVRTNTRVRTAELSKDAGTLATKLAQANGTGGSDRERRRTDRARAELADIASATAEQIDALHRHPTSKRRARTAARALHRLADRASKLEEQLQ
jgi:hypothetical protein